ncbi:DNA polymerase Y family protein [Halocalculus aciditolerans]|uniref:DNA polymerase IV n=1 Tax=Halocalculus aciditolerans TaxID=1383812 RepID=A0A830FBG4_9EURY|nr:DNA polymerase IV [Halocalculus aciditolerans]GGL58459.1 DNA polymerase IV [Halocalculus aciditolerans]
MERADTLPGTPDDAERIVLHVDMDCFYASCERRRNPELRGEPVVVGMGYEEGETIGAVATASYEAREYGVESAQAISQALEKLPRRANAGGDATAADADDNPGDPDTGIYVPVDHDYYTEVGQEVKEIVHDLGDTVREVSIDEAYLDVTESTAWGVAEGFARHVKQRIAREVGVPASVGVAPNMSTAKLASDADKPDGLVVVPPGEVEDFLRPIDIADVHGVGPVRAREFRAMGIETAGDLADADPYELVERFGERGRELYDRARGRDPRPVEPRGKPKSLSRESAFPEPTDDTERIREQVRALADAVAERATQKDALYRTIGIKVVTPPYDVNTRADSLPGPVDDPDLLRDTALDLLTEFDGERVRKVGVRVSKLSFTSGEQASLTGFETAADASADATTGTADDAADARDDASTPEDAEGDSAPVDGQADFSDFA